MFRLIGGIVIVIFGIICFITAGNNPNGPGGSVFAGLLCLVGGGLMITFGARFLKKGGRVRLAKRNRAPSAKQISTESNTLSKSPGVVVVDNTTTEDKKKEDRPIEKDSQWKPGTKLKFMTYNEAISALKSGDPARMEKAICDILNVPKVYNDISKSLNSPAEEKLLNLLIPLLKHEEYHVRCCIPGILEILGDASFIPHLEEVIKNDKDSQVVKNARIAIDKIKRLGVSTDVVKFLRRYTKPIDSTTTGTYEEYSAPNKNVARAYLEKMPPVTKPYFYIEIITPEGNIGKDNMGTF